MCGKEPSQTMSKRDDFYVCYLECSGLCFLKESSLQICSIQVNRPKNENKKKGQKVDRGTKFYCFEWVGGEQK